MEKKGFRKLYKRVSHTSSIILTETQKDITYLLIEERLTVEQIANIRHTSPQAVRKVIRRLKEKGVIKEVSHKGFFSGGYYPETTHSDNKEYRLHAIALTMRILEPSQFYYDLLKRANKDMIDNNSIELYAEKIVLYMNKDFWGNTVNQSVRLSLAYISNMITQIENRYKIWLVKGRRQEIRQFRGEIAKVGDPLAKLIDEKGDKFTVYDSNGYRRLIIDRSFKFYELEAVHKDMAIEDMSKIERFYRDRLENENLWLDSDMQKMIQVQAKTLSELMEITLSLAQTTQKLNDRVQELEKSYK